MLYFPSVIEDFKTKQVLEPGEKGSSSGQVVAPAMSSITFPRNRCLRFSLKAGRGRFCGDFIQPYLADKIELGATLAVFEKWDRATWSDWDEGSWLR